MTLYEELAKYQISKKELRRLYWRWKLIGDKKSKSLIINSFLPMALEIATNFVKKHPYIELMDLLNEAYLIIDKAIEYYNGKAEMSTFVYLMLNWNFKSYIQKQCSPVKYTASIRQKMKKEGISYNAVYLSELDKDTFISNGNPEEIFYRKEMDKKLKKELSNYLSEEEIEEIMYGKKIKKKTIKKVKSLSKGGIYALLGIRPE